MRRASTSRRRRASASAPDSPRIKPCSGHSTRCRAPLDPSFLTDVDGQKVTDDLFEGLTAIGLDGSMVPGVATSWEVSADGKNWVFHLRPEARWSNGDPVTSADFIYAWRRQVDPKTGTEYAQALAPIVGAMAIATGHAPVSSLGADAPDPLTLRIALNSPTPVPALLARRQFHATSAPCDDRALGRRLDPARTLGVERAVRRQRGGDRQPHHAREEPAVLGRGERAPKPGHLLSARDPHAGGPLHGRGHPVHEHFSKFAIQVAEVPARRPGVDGSVSRHLADVGEHAGAALCHEPRSAPRLEPGAGSQDSREQGAGRTSGGPLSRWCPPLPGYRQQVPEWATWSDERRHAEARRLYAAAGYSPRASAARAGQLSDGRGQSRRVRCHHPPCG